MSQLKRPIREDYKTQDDFAHAFHLFNLDYDLIYSDADDRDEDGNLLSCCGSILDEDIMICPTCGEHC